MITMRLTASDGEVLTGRLPFNWEDTPLAPYVAFICATTMPQRCEAVAALVGLPAAPFLTDVSLILPILRACPFLDDDSLPDEGTGPVPEIQHLGILYRHVGDLHKINAGQMEALFGFLAQHQGQPLTAGPALLAVLYCRDGAEQTGDEVEAATLAFASLPMALAWPALMAFFRSSSTAATSIRSASALISTTEKMLNEMEKALTVGASTTFWRKPLTWLTRMWLRNVRKML